MVYSSRFVMCVLRDGIPQQELGDGTVVLPFGAEYALRFRNKNPDRRAVVKIFIDGENVSGGGFVILANDKVDIERPVNKAVRFRFVSLTSSEAVEFGKDGPNVDRKKGVIEAHFYLERAPLPALQRIPSTPDAASYRNSATDLDRAQVLEDGCTVEGGHSSQRFRYVDVDLEANATVLRLVLRGIDPQDANSSRPAATPKKQRGKRSSELDALEAEIEDLKRRNAALELVLLKKQRDELESKLGS